MNTIRALSMIVLAAVLADIAPSIGAQQFAPHYHQPMPIRQPPARFAPAEALANLAAVNAFDHVHHLPAMPAFHTNPPAMATSVHHLHPAMFAAHQQPPNPIQTAPLFHHHHSSSDMHDHSMHQQQQSSPIRPQFQPQHQQQYGGMLQPFRGDQLSMRRSLPMGNINAAGHSSALLVRCHPSVQRVPCPDAALGHRFTGGGLR